MEIWQTAEDAGSEFSVSSSAEIKHITSKKVPRTVLQSKQDPSWWSEMQICSLFMQMRSRAAEQDVKPDAMSDFRTKPRSKLWALMWNKQALAYVCVCVCVIDSPVKSSLLFLLFSVLSAALHYELLLPTRLWCSLKATWTFSWMFCDHKNDKNATFYIQPKGHHVND